MVPHVVGLKESQAIIALENLQLRARIVRERKAAIMVASQTPAAPTKISRGSTVTLYLR
jgi:beta-lactam-binding protein with PASTA domain